LLVFAGNNLHFNNLYKIKIMKIIFQNTSFFVFFAICLCLFLILGCSDDDCDESFATEPVNPIVSAFLSEVEKVEETNGTFVLFKEGASFESSRGAGIQIHGDFNAEGPQLNFNQVELLDEFNGYFYTISEQSRGIIETSYTNGSTVSIDLFDRDTTRTRFLNLSIKFPKQLIVEAQGSEQILTRNRFNSNSLLKWEPDPDSNAEIIILIAAGPGIELPWETNLTSPDYAYNVISTVDDGLYQLSSSNFNGLKLGETMTILILRHNRVLHEHSNGAVDMVIAATATGGTYVLSDSSN
jgi:hypothetical protein